MNLQNELVGKKIRMIKMVDDYPIEPNTIGEIWGVDDIGQLKVRWENGRTLSVIPEIDEFEIQN